MNQPWMIFARHAVKLLGWSLLFQEGAARCGVGLLPFFRRRPFGPLGRTGAGALLGWGAYGTALLGLAALGLFHPGVCVALAVACVLGSRALLERRPLLWDAARAARPIGGTGLGLFALGLSPRLVSALTPALEQDSYIYHLGMPWQWLQAGRLFAGDIPFPFQVPMLLDLPNVLVVLLGDERLGKCLVLGSLLAGSMFWADRCLARGRSTAAWAGPLLAISADQVLMLLNTSKNDLPACMHFLVGACLTLDGAWMLGAVFLGLSLAAKFVFGPQIAIWLLLIRPPRRLWVPAAALLILPSMPWWWKTWVATANPVYPFAVKLFGRFDWQEANQTTFNQFQLPLWPAQTLAWKDILTGSWFQYMKLEHLTLVLALPGLLLLGRTRLLALACIAGQVVTLGTGHLLRYWIPSTVLLSCIVAEELGGWKGWRRNAANGLLAGYALFRISIYPPIQGYSWHDAWAPLEKARLDHISKYGDAVASLNALKPGRLISVGDIREYLLPGRVVYGGASGETPLMWRLAQASVTADRMRVKMRQLGSGLLLYNYVSADWLANRYVPFPWTPRMIGVYQEYAVDHLELIGTTNGNDFNNGGFCLFRVNQRVPKPRPTSVLFLPGTESLYAESIALESQKRQKEALDSVMRNLAMMPHVGHAWNAAGHAWAVVGNSRKAFEYLVKFGSFMDQLNVPELAWAALREGRIDMAEQLLQFSITHYPDQIGTIHVNLAQVREQRASICLSQGKTKQAAAWIAEAEQHMALVPADVPNPALQESRRLVLATLWAIKGEWNIQKGDNTNAVACLRQALNLSPNDQMAPRWNAAIKALPLTFSSLGAGH